MPWSSVRGKNQEIRMQEKLQRKWKERLNKERKKYIRNI